MVGAVWVVLIAVPLLVSLWLVLNLLDGAAPNSPARIARITALVIIGVALMETGVSTVMTLWTSSFARFMYLEDLGTTNVAEITRNTPVDHGLLLSGAVLALLGAAALIAAAALVARHRGRAGR